MIVADKGILTGDGRGMVSSSGWSTTAIVPDDDNADDGMDCDEASVSVRFIAWDGSSRVGSSLDSDLDSYSGCEVVAVGNEFHSVSVSDSGTGGRSDQDPRSGSDDTVIPGSIMDPPIRLSVGGGEDG